MISLNGEYLLVAVEHRTGLIISSSDNSQISSSVNVSCKEQSFIILLVLYYNFEFIFSVLE